MSAPVFRFAPSPNGYLHLGHALSALLNFDMARATGGRLLLRMEDIDPVRSRPPYEDAIREDLAWLGVRWEEPVWRQSEHFDAYRAALDRLSALGLLYPSVESRGEIARMVTARGREWPRDPDGVPLYPGTARALSPAERAACIASGKPYALRLDMASASACAGPLTFTETGSGPEGQSGTVAADPRAWGDVVLGRKKLPASYHLCVVTDDARQGVTHVVRGRDLFRATSVHRVLQTLLELPVPTYHHHPLVLDEGGRKLSKSTQATSLRALRARGVTPADIRRLLGVASGDKP